MPSTNQYADLLVCPVSQGKLEFNAEAMRLDCAESQLGYPIVDGVPVMLPEKAVKLGQAEA